MQGATHQTMASGFGLHNVDEDRGVDHNLELAYVGPRREGETRDPNLRRVDDRKDGVIVERTRSTKHEGGYEEARAQGEKKLRKGWTEKEVLALLDVSHSVRTQVVCVCESVRA